MPLWILAADSTSPLWLTATVSLLAAMASGLGVFVAFKKLIKEERTEHEDVVCTQVKRSWENFHNGLLIVDRQLVILRGNKQARAITGYGIELAGKSVYDLIPEDLRDKHREHVKRFFSDPHTRRMGGSSKFPMKDRFGQTVMLMISLSPTENEFGSFEVTVGMDVIQEA